MTREEQKAYNAENYPASVLTWLDEATDRAYDDFESRTCENCKHFNHTRCGVVTYYVNVAENNPQVDLDFGCNRWNKKDDI